MYQNVYRQQCTPETRECYTRKFGLQLCLWAKVQLSAELHSPQENMLVVSCIAAVQIKYQIKVIKSHMNKKTCSLYHASLQSRLNTKWKLSNRTWTRKTEHPFTVPKTSGSTSLNLALSHFQYVLVLSHGVLSADLTWVKIILRNSGFGIVANVGNYLEIVKYSGC